MLEHEGLRRSNVRLGVQYPPHTRRSPCLSRCGYFFWQTLRLACFAFTRAVFLLSSHTRGMYGFVYPHSFAITTLGSFLIRDFQHGGHLVGTIRRFRVAVLWYSTLFVAGGYEAVRWEWCSG
jgi:hypothetical protein